MAVQIELRFVPGMAGCRFSGGLSHVGTSRIPKYARRPTRDFDRKCTPSCNVAGDPSRKKKKKRRSSQSTTFYVPCDPAQWVVDATTIQPRLWPLYFSVTQFPGEHGCRISRKTLKRWFFTTSRRQPRNCSTPNSEVIIAFSSLRNSSGL